MTTTRVADINGDTILLKNDNGRWMSPIFQDIDSLSSFVARPDDIILCSYPRSGTHWCRTLLWMTVNDSWELPPTALDAMLEEIGCDEIEKLPSPRIINTHLKPKDLPQDIFTKKCKIVLVIRNPKDIALSYFFFMSSRKVVDYSGKFDGFLSLFKEGKVPCGSWFDYAKGWETVVSSGCPCPVLPVYYAQLKKDFVSTMSNVGDFVGFSRSQDFYSNMEKQTTVDNFKRTFAETSSAEEKAMWKSNVNYARKGVVGDWRNWFTVAQNEEFDELIRQTDLLSSLFKFN